MLVINDYCGNQLQMPFMLEMPHQRTEAPLAKSVAMLPMHLPLPICQLTMRQPSRPPQPAPAFPVSAAHTPATMQQRKLAAASALAA